VHALDEALAQLDGALAAAAALGLGPEDRRVAFLHRDRGAFRYDFLGDFAGSRADLEAALAGARMFGDASLEVQALLTMSGVERAEDSVSSLERLVEAVGVAEAAGDPALQVAALSRLSIHRSVLLELDEGLACGNRALEMAGQTGDSSARAVALDAVKLVAGLLGDVALLDDACSEILAARDDEAVRPGFRMEARAYRAWALQEWSAGAGAVGDWELAQTRARRAIEENRELGGVSHHPVFLDALARIQRSTGDYGAALRTARQASEDAHGIAHREWTAWTDATLGWVLLDLRSVELAVEALESGLQEAERGSAPWRRVLCLGLLAWARGALGQREPAAELAARGEQALAAVSLPPGGAFMGGAPAYLGIARAHLAIGDPERAEATLRPIADSAERLGWREYAAAALLVGGLAAAARNDADRARTSLSTALDVADAIGLPGVAWEAHAALASLTGDGAVEHAAAARAEVERIAAGVDDQAIRERFLAEALGSLDAAAA
jgi:tetratricopeptide (TPR) repeat protein